MEKWVTAGTAGEFSLPAGRMKSSRDLYLEERDWGPLNWFTKRVCHVTARYFTVAPRQVNRQYWYSLCVWNDIKHNSKQQPVKHLCLYERICVLFSYRSRIYECSIIIRPSTLEECQKLIEIILSKWNEGAVYVLNRSNGNKSSPSSIVSVCVCVFRWKPASSELRLV